MRLSLAVAAIVPLLVGCAVDRGGNNVNQQAVVATETMDASRETFALGTELAPGGGVSERGASDSFKRGGEVYLSVDVSGSSTDQKIEVQWMDPNGGVIRSDERVATQGAKYVPFSSGRTASWRPGDHRAVVLIDGRKVTEKAFRVM